jgi:hypothetical protein
MRANTKPPSSCRQRDVGRTVSREIAHGFFPSIVISYLNPITDSPSRAITSQNLCRECSRPPSVPLPSRSASRRQRRRCVVAAPSDNARPEDWPTSLSSSHTFCLRAAARRTRARALIPWPTYSHISSRHTAHSQPSIPYSVPRCRSARRPRRCSTSRPGRTSGTSTRRRRASTRGTRRSRAPTPTSTRSSATATAPSATPTAASPASRAATSRRSAPT